MSNENVIEFEEVRSEARQALKFSIRPLRAKDVAPMVRIVSKIGLREFKDVISLDAINVFVEKAEMSLEGESPEGEGAPNDGGADAVASLVGVGAFLDAAGIVCENFDKAEADIFRFLASVSGQTVKEVEELPIADLFELVFAVFKAPDFGDFFTRVKALLK